jgi:hypothetical protein
MAMSSLATLSATRSEELMEGGKGKGRTVYTEERRKKEFVREYEGSGETVSEFAKRTGMNVGS